MYSRDDLEAAQQAGVLDRQTLDRLLGFLAGRPQLSPPALQVAPARFDFSHLLWYAGALIIMGAMGLFSTTAFSLMGGKALTITALVYAAGFVFAGHKLWTGHDLRTPGGLLIACAVAMAPLAVFGVQDWMGWWIDNVRPGNVRDYYIWIKGGWVPMEIATIIAACVALYFFPFPFIVAVAALALWFFSMDVAELIIDRNQLRYGDYWSLRRSITQWFGLALIFVAWFVDTRRVREDFAFWLHLAGITAFWGAVTAQSSDSEVSKAIYCLMNVGLLFLAVFLMRRVYAVFGALGVSFYLGHLASRVFKDSLLFPFALSLIGLAVIGLGIYYFRNRERIQQGMEAALPEALKRLRPAHARESHVPAAAGGVSAEAAHPTAS